MVDVRSFGISFLMLLVVGLMAGSRAIFALDPGAAEGIWLFDEGSGKVAHDASGKGRDGEVQNAKWTKGVFGSALEFDGSSSNVLITGYMGVGGTQPRTTLLWFKANDVRDHSWVKWGIVEDTRKYYVRAHVDGNNCYLRVETQGGQHYGSTNVCDGDWHHLAVVFPPDSSMVKDHLLYVDGMLETVTGGNDVGVDTDATTQEVNIGAPLAHHTYANGLMDEVAIFSEALSEDDIQSIVQNGLLQALSVDPAGKAAVTWGSLKRSF